VQGVGAAEEMGSHQGVLGNEGAVEDCEGNKGRGKPASYLLEGTMSYDPVQVVPRKCLPA
jgi:hypothetical protein